MKKMKVYVFWNAGADDNVCAGPVSRYWAEEYIGRQQKREDLTFFVIPADEFKEYCENNAVLDDYDDEA